MNEEKRRKAQQQRQKLHGKFRDSPQLLVSSCFVLLVYFGSLSQHHSALCALFSTLLLLLFGGSR